VHSTFGGVARMQRLLDNVEFYVYERAVFVRKQGEVE
jgi:hypothetical protein